LEFIWVSERACGLSKYLARDASAQRFAQGKCGEFSLTYFDQRKTGCTKAELVYDQATQHYISGNLCLHKTFGPGTPEQTKLDTVSYILYPGLLKTE